MDKTKNDITIYSNSPLKLSNDNQLFQIQKGKVNIFAITSFGKKEYITSFEEGDIFFSLKVFYHEELSMELYAGTVEPIIKQIEYKSIQKKNIINTVEKLNTFTQDDKHNLKHIDNSNELFTFLSNKFKSTMDIIKSQQKQNNDIQLQHLKNDIDTNNSLIKNAVTSLASIYDENIKIKDSHRDDGLLFSTVLRICSYLDIKPKEIDLKLIDKHNPVMDISKALNIKARPVRLINNWYNEDSGALLGFTKDQVPVALIPISSTSYNLVDLQTNSISKINKDSVSELLNVAYMFYKPLPQKSLTLKDLLKFITFGNKKDFIFVVILGILSGLIAIIQPLATGVLFDNLIPEANKSQIIQIGMALIAAAFSMASFNFVRGIALARIRSRISLNLQSAIWDRLINLPTSFFRKYSTGDLALRANGINKIQEVLSGTVLSTLISGIFSIFSFLLLFKYSTKLAFIGLLLVFIAILFNIISTIVQLKYKKKILAISGEISSLLLEIISGIQKIKIANATNRAYSKWAKQFYLQRDLSYKSGYLQNYLEIFNIIFPLFVSIVIFSVIAFSIKEDKQFTTGEFIAFNAAFSQFLTAALALSGVVVSILNIKPLYERVSPILQEVPEVQVQSVNPGKLQGNIEVKNLSFKYTPNSKNILNKVSLNIKNGEFIALIGSSGSGKSTLLRLLLGFEEANEGNIFYDNQNLQDIDIRVVRSQLGVVLQNGRIIAGSIFTNIIGSSNKSIEDAWKAAKKAGFDTDIEQMPMGMHTVVADGGGTLSGGQKQRLLISKALINDPKIIYFDEATSALDNKTQEVVTKSLDALNSTRIVIAHRLSTIKNADKIYVLDQGKIVQCGNYDKLMKEDGLFKKLALRQIA